jgi:hypothetical protein
LYVHVSESGAALFTPDADIAPRKPPFEAGSNRQLSSKIRGVRARRVRHDAPSLPNSGR